MTAVRARLFAHELLPVLGLATATAMLAQLSFHAWPVPFTLQAAAVLASGLLLGARRGAAAQVAYLLAGAAGLPVFAESKFGPQWLFGPTGGYLLAFPLVAAIAGWAAARWQGWRLALAVFGANVALLAVGTLWLSVVLGHFAWREGFAPFLTGAVAQTAAALAVGQIYRRR